MCVLKNKPAALSVGQTLPSLWSPADVFIPPSGEKAVGDSRTKSAPSRPGGLPSAPESPAGTGETREGVEPTAARAPCGWTRSKGLILQSQDPGGPPVLKQTLLGKRQGAARLVGTGGSGA